MTRESTMSVFSCWMYARYASMRRRNMSSEESLCTALFTWSKIRMESTRYSDFSRVVLENSVLTISTFTPSKVASVAAASLLSTSLSCVSFLRSRRSTLTSASVTKSLLHRLLRSRQSAPLEAEIVVAVERHDPLLISIGPWSVLDQRGLAGLDLLDRLFEDVERAHQIGMLVLRHHIVEAPPVEVNEVVLRHPLAHELELVRAVLAQHLLHLPVEAVNWLLIPRDAQNLVLEPVGNHAGLPRGHVIFGVFLRAPAVVVPEGPHISAMGGVSRFSVSTRNSHTFSRQSNFSSNCSKLWGLHSKSAAACRQWFSS
ncbi:hypothetical protein SS50377_20407 [Spironucleus salmonicida]|uniref:Uncharacterized protein n=1 Tax=Spironucleus salmonicida TaxID=348837 RepID=V6LVE5_9EUKA|nr:hypothetical protein SS50377_20407 [Spironucleus salmonicida]|eukprot:EST48203.1 Hypothetical protein SS50377_ja056 [Spironucleus salmonicida]